MKSFVISVLLFVILTAISVASEPEESSSPLPERRKNQFSTDAGYAIFPYPYSLPGIGSGLGVIGAAMNVRDTCTDLYGIMFSGDVRGTALGIGDLHIIPRRLLLEIGYGSLNEATIQSYSQRGMLADKLDYRLIELGDTEYYGARATATFYDRRFELYGAWYQGASRLKSIRDRNGVIIIEAQDAPRERGHQILLGARLDLTDDYADPRRGLRIDVTRSQTPSRDSGPDFYVVDYNLTAYLPIGSRHTFAVNALQSDAVVKRQGQTDRLAIQQEQGIDCASSSLTPDEQQYCSEVVDNMIANNTYGTATELGGFSRLRGFPQGRFKGAHTRFVGAELRWNLTEERTPFNIFIMKDVRTAVQASLFYETGTTADLRSDLGATWRDSYGAGLRVVTASGVVLRGDIGIGREGVTPAIFIGYPWEI